MYWWVRAHISAIAFASGFLWDTLTLQRIDLLYENIVFTTYLVVALTGIVLVHSVETRTFAPKWLLQTRAWLPAVVQFPLGGLFSGFVIFYTKSASLFTSWPFITILLVLLIGNEFFRKRYEKLVFQLGMFYFALLSYVVLVTPVVLGTVGTATFVFAGIFSLVVMGAIVQGLKKMFPKLVGHTRSAIPAVIGSVYLGFTFMYFTNVIPPVPLALKDIGVYHMVVRAGTGEYLVRYEEPHWFEVWRNTASTYHRVQGEAVHCFSSVFAPTQLRTPIYHSWQRRSEDGGWVRDTRVRFTIEGGREQGYRGYTIKQNIKEGEWRCVVETERKQVVGEVRFQVVDVATSTPLIEDVR